MKDEVLTSKQAAQLLMMTEKTLDKMTISKKLPAVESDGGWQYKKQELLHWLRLQSCWQVGE